MENNELRHYGIKGMKWGVCRFQNEDGSYSMDFENLEAVADEKCRMLLLSNPHNPGGVVWDRETLVRLADFCHRRHILVISDEIHCDMALWGNKHIPFATVSEEAASCSITFGAPSKTFNIAGIVSSYAIVPDRDIRSRFFGWLKANELDEAPLFAPIATIAAFREGESWRREMLGYVEGNIDFVMDYCRKHLPALHRTGGRFYARRRGQRRPEAAAEKAWHSAGRRAQGVNCAV